MDDPIDIFGGQAQHHYIIDMDKNTAGILKVLLTYYLCPYSEIMLWSRTRNLVVNFNITIHKSVRRLYVRLFM